MPPDRENTAALIPCLNEARTIGAMIRGIRAWTPAVLVVDDGSTDATAREAADAGAEVLRHPAPQGKGASLAEAWQWAGRRGFTWVLMLDGDGQHLPEDAPTLLAAATGNVRLVVGNRMDQPAGMPWLRRATNRWLSGRLSELAGVPLPDSQCGYRLAHLPTLLSLELHARHFEIESEMVLAFARAGHAPVFVPVQVRYGAERSKISPWRDTRRWWRWYQAEKRRVRGL